MAAAYDLGCAIYFAVPTAPPWWAAEEGYMPADEPRARARRSAPTRYRHGAPDHGRGRRADLGARLAEPLYDSLGGNPWAAMPSLHFATSLLAALLLSEVGPSAGAAGWAYALTLGFALVYLGEHYVIDLIAGAALVVARCGAGEPLGEPAARPGQRAWRSGWSGSRTAEHPPRPRVRGRLADKRTAGPPDSIRGDGERP